MPSKRWGTPASQLARDYGVSLNEFATAIIDIVVGPDPAETPGRGASQRREVCAAVSAAMVLALESSTLSEEERTRLQPMIHDVLLPYWARHCCQNDSDVVRGITERMPHYTGRRVAGSHVKSSVAIVGALLEAMEVPDTRRQVLVERLAPAFAHRIVGDVYRINDLRMRHGIELSLLATMCTLLQLSMSYDPLLRALRLG
jgi:hypothetical protein